jgi:hypothetical protein
MPVSALTNAVLPWSMCPAVPTMMCFMVLALKVKIQDASSASQTTSLKSLESLLFKNIATLAEL